MTIWHTSDWHVGHNNILKFCNRPFNSIEHMNQVLIANYNAVVAPEDTVYFLGDICMGQIGETLPLCEQLNGNKLLIAGNHDRIWAGHGEKAAKWYPRYEEVGFTIIDIDQFDGRNGYPHMLQNGTPVLLSHFPYISDERHQDRFVDWLPTDDGHTLLLHGHTHGLWRKNGRQIDVGVDNWNYSPVSEEQLIALM